jgi:hypothetical protein
VTLSLINKLKWKLVSDGDWLYNHKLASQLHRSKLSISNEMVFFNQEVVTKYCSNLSSSYAKSFQASQHTCHI